MASLGIRSALRLLKNDFRSRLFPVSASRPDPARSRLFHSRQINEDAPKVLITGEAGHIRNS